MTYIRFPASKRIHIGLVLGCVGLAYVWSFGNEPALRSPDRFAPLTILVMLHAALHVVLLRRPMRQGWLVAYFAMQVVVVFGISMVVNVSEVINIPIFLYVILAAEAARFFPKWWTTVLSVGGLYLLHLLTLIIVYGWDWLIIGFVGSAPLMLLATVIAMLFMQQAFAQTQATHMIEQLEQSQQQLAAYAAQVEDLTLQTERRRMARELHDTLAQGIAGLILQLEAVSAHQVDGRYECAQAIVQQAMVHARMTLNTSRRAIDDLREDQCTVDVAEVIYAETAHFTELTGIHCSIKLTPMPPFEAPRAEHIRRMVIEGLANIVRHAQAQHVWIQSHTDNQGVEITIRDNGIGFTSDTLAEQPGHYGLLGMQERSGLLGGQMTIRSMPGAGTSLHLWVPFDDREIVYGQADSHPDSR